MVDVVVHLVLCTSVSYDSTNQVVIQAIQAILHLLTTFI